MKQYFFYPIILLLLAACSSTKDANAPMEWTPVYEGKNCSVMEPKVQIVNSTEDWKAIWGDIGGGTALPAINFEEKMLLAAFRGNCPTSGYEIDIQNIELNKDKLDVSLLYTTPGKECMVAMMMTQAFQVVAVDRVEAREIEISVKNKAKDCTDEGHNFANEPAPMTVTWEEVAQGAYCGINQEKRFVITAEASWEATWKEVGANRFPPPKLPQVNFSEKAIVALFMGDRSNGGYEQGIINMEMKDDSLLVEIAHVTPGNNCITTEAIVQPYNIVSIDKQYAQVVTFKVKEVTRDCN